MLETILIIILVAGGLLLCVLGVLFLIFHREIAAIRLARRLGAVMDDPPCSQCGECCRLTVITNRKTVDQIAETTDMPIHEFAQRLPFKLYRMKKGPEGACVLLRQTGKKNAPFVCGVYPNRPAACRRFPVIRFPFGIKGCDPRCTPLRKQARDKGVEEK